MFHIYKKDTHTHTHTELILKVLIQRQDETYSNPFCMEFAAVRFIHILEFHQLMKHLLNIINNKLSL